MTKTHQAEKLTLRDGLEILIQSEMDTRHHNKIARLIKNAGFRQGASLEELETSESRGTSAGIISQLSTGEYINQGATIVISGPTGTGKSFLATALGENACRLGYRVKYYTLTRLLDEVRLARLEGKELKFFEKMENLDLLIIDDFGMKKLEGQQQNNFEQIIDYRYHKNLLHQVKLLLRKDKRPKYIIRTDIQYSFESIPKEQLFELIENNTLLDYKIKRC